MTKAEKESVSEEVVRRGSANKQSRGSKEACSKRRETRGRRAHPSDEPADTG